MKNNFFVPGMLALAFALIFTSCDTGTSDNGENNDPKTLVITGIPSDVFEAWNEYYYNDGHYNGSIGLFPTGTTQQQAGEWKTVVAGADLSNPDIIIRGSGSSGPYTLTVPLYVSNISTNVIWDGSGTFDVYLIFWDSVYSRIHRGDSIKISSGTTTVPFSNVTVSQIWEDKDMFTWFSTNDPREYDRAWWNFYENINDRNIYEIECKRMSGDRNSGYGMVFGASNTDNREYYLLEITTQGNYWIGKYSNEKFTTIKAWTGSEKLSTGYNTINTLKVLKNGTNFTVYLNGSQVFQFTDTEINGDRLGYRAGIGSEKDESFPNTPVDVRFRQKFNLPANHLVLPANTMVTGTITTPGVDNWYTITVTKGTTYYLWWYDRDNTEGVLDIKVAAYYSNGTLIFDQDTPNIYTFTAQASDTVYVRVYPLNNGDVGTYGIIYNTTYPNL